jgi:parvulin-like peptidyl-prolyl isomerase
MSVDFEEQSVEIKDNTKLIWGAILGLFALMVLFLMLSPAPKPNESMVRVRHILIACDQTDLADRSQALQTARDLREQIVSGESFAKLAKKFSDDPSTASSGGLLSPAARGIYAPEFERFSWSADVGETSDVLTTTYGFHIAQVIERYIDDAEIYNDNLDRRAREELRKENEQQMQDNEIPRAVPPTGTTAAEQ